MIISKKKILFLVNADWAFMVNRLPIAIEALKKGYEVHIACAFTGKESDLLSYGFVMHNIPFTRSGHNPFVELRALKNIYSLIRKLRPSIIHAITIKPVLYGGVISRILKVPGFAAAISGLGYIFTGNDLKVRILRKFVEIAYRFALSGNVKVIFQNPFDRSVLQKIANIDSNNIRMIKGSGVDLDEYSVTAAPEGVPVVAMASRLLKEKGVYEFVEAARSIKAKGTSCRFLLIGAPDFGNPYSITNEEIEHWRSEGVIETLGYRTDIADLFSKANVVALPSYYGEGLPKVLIEAAACGRPTVTTDNPGCAEAVIDNITGLIVPCKNSIKLCDAIERLIDNKSLRDEMGRQGRLLAEKEFDIKSVVEKHFSIYEELLADSKV